MYVNFNLRSAHKGGRIRALIWIYENIKFPKTKQKLVLCSVSNYVKNQVNI